MNKTRLLKLSIALGLFILFGQQYNLFGTNQTGSFPKLPTQANFTVSTEFDGQWLGRRNDSTGNNMCERTTMSGHIENGFAIFMLDYNGTSLKGWINDETGELYLYANNRQWDYRFSGKAYKNRVQGNWHLANGPCKGSWYLEKQS